MAWVATQWAIHRLLPLLTAILLLYGGIFFATRLVGRRMREVFRFGKPVEIAPGSGRVYLIAATAAGAFAGVGFGLFGRPSPLIGSLRCGAVLLAHVGAFYLARRRGEDVLVDDHLLRAKHKKYICAIIAPFLIAVLVCSIVVGMVLSNL